MGVREYERRVEKVGFSAEISYPCAVVWYSSGHTLVPADSLGIPGSIYWTNMPDTPPVATSNAHQAYLFIQKKKK